MLDPPFSSFASRKVPFPAERAGSSFGKIGCREAHVPSPSSAVNFENTNRTAVADRARAKQAARHQAEVDRKVRDKAANKADKDAKAKAKEERKKKAVKGERRR